MKSRKSLDWIGSLLYDALRVPIRAALKSYFRSVEVRDAERIPPSGPLLVIANHPATLSEVFLLGTRLGRRFHFLAASFVFRPWIVGVFVRLCGALPVYRRQDDPNLTYRNEETFRACHEAFDRGGAIVIFPEGESEADRKILPLKTGAARLSLAYDSKPLVVVPVGVYFSDRTAFQSDVTLSVGPPIDLAPYAKMGIDDPHGAVRQLTAVMQKSLESLILSVPHSAMSELIRDVERLYLEDLRETRPGEPDLTLLRRVTECIYYYRETDSQRLYTGWRRTVAYGRKLRALGLADSVLKDRVSTGTVGRCAARLAVGGAFGLAPAVAGLLVNYAPFLATRFAASRIAPETIRVSAGRIVAGLVLFPIAYALAAAGLRLGAGWSWIWVATFLALCLPLGYFALIYVRWLKKEREVLALAILTSRRRRLVAKLRAERKGLIRFFDAAREDYLAKSTPREKHLTLQ